MAWFGLHGVCRHCIGVVVGHFWVDLEAHAFRWAWLLEADLGDAFVEALHDGVMVCFIEHRSETFSEEFAIATLSAGEVDVTGALGASQDLWVLVNYFKSLRVQDWPLVGCDRNARTVALELASRGAHLGSNRIVWLELNLSVTCLDQVVVFANKEGLVAKGSFCPVVHIVVL